MAGAPCTPPASQRRRARCPLHREKLKNFQSFSVSLGMKRLSRFYDFRPMAEPAASYEEQNSDVKIYRADITNRPTRGSEISGERRFGFPGLEAPLALFPLHVLIGSALSTIKGYAHVRAEKKNFFCLPQGGTAGVRCRPSGKHTSQCRCPLHRSRSKKFQSFSVSLGMKRLCRFHDSRTLAEPRHHTRSKKSDVKIYRADIAAGGRLGDRRLSASSGSDSPASRQRSPFFPCMY